MRFKVWLLLISSVACMSLSAGCSGSSGKSVEALTGEEEIRIPVSVVSAQRGMVRSYTRVVGTVQPLSEAELSSKIPGVVEAIHADEGEEIKKGDVIVQLERRELEVSKKQAQAFLEIAKVNLETATLEWERAQKLSEEGVFSQRQYDQAYNGYKAAAANLRQADANVEMTQTQLDNTRIVAPFSGVIVQKFVNEGERVSPGRPLVKLMDLTAVEVEAEVTEKKVAQTKIGQTAKVEIDSYPGEIFHGEITKIRPIVDPRSRTFKVTVQVPNDDGRLKAGMFARLTISAENKVDVLVLPKKAILERRDKRTIFIVEDSVARLREVEVGLEGEGVVEVTSGLQEGEVVIVQGNYGLPEGARIIAQVLPSATRSSASGSRSN